MESWFDPVSLFGRYGSFSSFLRSLFRVLVIRVPDYIWDSSDVRIRMSLGPKKEP